MFRSNLRSCVHAGLAAALLVATAVPVMAQEDRGPPGQQGRGQEQPPQPQKKKHHSGVGAAIGAGVLGGLVGGAILGGQGQAAPGYPPPGYAPPPPPPPRYGPPPGAYDAEADDEPVCHIVRRPIYDEDGQVVDYRTRRVCR